MLKQNDIIQVIRTILYIYIYIGIWSTGLGTTGLETTGLDIYTIIYIHGWAMLYGYRMAMVLKYCSVLLVYTCMSWNLTFLGVFCFFRLHFFSCWSDISILYIFPEWNVSLHEMPNSILVRVKNWHIVFDWNFQPFFSPKSPRIKWSLQLGCRQIS